jgi:hypothetical protein
MFDLVVNWFFVGNIRAAAKFPFSNYRSSNYHICICFLYGCPLKGMKTNNGVREGFCGVIKDSAVLLRPRKGLP